MNSFPTLIDFFNKYFNGVSKPSPQSMNGYLMNLWSLCTSLGEKALESVILGLSRRTKLDRDDIGSLISEWEQRNIKCCYSGTVNDIFKLENTAFFAVSYKHASPSTFHRKGRHLISKMDPVDEQLLIESLLEFGKKNKIHHVILWCDQVISTRLDKPENENIVKWYLSGLIPYAVLPVLKLSLHIPEEELENRIWIRAERSLGRMGMGTVYMSKPGFSVRLGNCGAVNEVLTNLIVLILNGYWPKDIGYWKNDYEEMKQWALYSACRSATNMKSLFESVQPLTNIDVIGSMVRLSTFANGVHSEEKMVSTDDVNFIYKATAWNLNVETLMNSEHRTVSHYMGKMGTYYRFSWWTQENSGNMFGYLVEASFATAIIAVKSSSGPSYDVYRTPATPFIGIYGERLAGDAVLVMIDNFSNLFSVDVSLSPIWKLTYCWKEHIIPPSLGALKFDFDRADKLADVIMPTTFQNCTAHLFQARMACEGVDSNDTDAQEPIATEFRTAIKIWNEFIRSRYEQVLTVSDSCGYTWLEGYNSTLVTCAFLHFLTTKTQIGSEAEPTISNFTYLRDKHSVYQEIRKLAEDLSSDHKLLANELFPPGESKCDEKLSDKDVAKFMLFGGFTSGMDLNQYSRFLERVGYERNYYITVLVCRSGILQIRFSGGLKGVQFAERKSTCTDFTAMGFVDPRDAANVSVVSHPLPDTECAQNNNWFKHNSCGETTDRKELHKLFKHSTRLVNGHQVLTLDMSSICDGHGEQQPSNILFEDSGDLSNQHGFRNKQDSEEEDQNLFSSISSPEKCDKIVESLHKQQRLLKELGNENRKKVVGIESQNFEEIEEQYNQIQSENMKLILSLQEIINKRNSSES